VYSVNGSTADSKSASFGSTPNIPTGYAKGKIMKFVDSPENFNSDVSIVNAKYGGCVGQRACTNCGALNSGTCLCMGIFTCANCQHKNEPEYLKQFKELPVVDWRSSLPEPENNYKISDTPYVKYER
jgi:hypothetical protein